MLETGVGDDGGFHIYVAREKDAFRWTMLATLRLPNWDSGPWTGYTCVTGSGRYAVAVYAPSFAVNRPRLMEAGAFASVIDVATGAVRPVASGVALQYFSPSCGTGDDVLLTRAIGADEQQTDLLRVDAAAGRVTRTTRVAAQVTTPVPGPDGDYGIVGGQLVRIDPTGRLHAVATPVGHPFALHTAGTAGLDLLTVQGDRSVAERWSAGRLTRLGDAPKGHLQLFGLRGGRDVLVGQTNTVNTAAAPGLVTIPLSGRAAAVSTDGHLAALDVEPLRLQDQVESGPQHKAVPPGRLRVTVLATHSGRRSTTEVAPTVGATVSSPIVAGTPGTASPHAISPNDNLPLPASETDPECVVPRNDPQRQVLQPTAAMVEWAVDQAVHGDLTVSRPADYLHTGEPAYTPQGMFQKVTLHGAPSATVPAQVMLGVLAQETNFRQATFHARPGDGGNPFIADYYGDEPSIDFIDYAMSDCGYGISQVTDGMDIGDTVTYNAAQQVAIATDYTANIAAGLQILTDKWNQLADNGLFVNDADPSYVENWYLALWAYNSGFHTPDAAGNWGVGWLNNPANPQYPADRDPFLRDSTADASHPADWSYEEKVMGWIESPQHTYFDTPSYIIPAFGISGHLALPSQTAFCSTVNSCDPANRTNPCPNDDDSCWWHGVATWATCTQDCATESLNFGLGESEPGMVAQYTPDCEPPSTAQGVIIVDDLPDSGVNVVGCDSHPSGGKFTIRTGDDFGDSSVVGEVDLHQLGAAYGGHMWFTHTYPADNLLNLVTGTWIPDNISPSGQTYNIYAHMPDHGGAATATYHFDLGSGAFTGSSVVSQNTEANEWVAIGQFPLHPGARVQLQNNTGGDGTDDLAFDALEFIPLPPAPVVGLGGRSAGLPPATVAGGRGRVRATRRRQRRGGR